jgi:hypothetical protein
MDYFTKQPNAYAVPNQELSLVTIFFCYFGLLRRLQNDQGLNFDSSLMQVLQRLGVGKTTITSLHPRSDGMAERYIKTAEEHLSSTITAAICEAGQRQNESRYDRLANSSGFQKSDSLFRPTRTKTVT